MSNDFDEKRIVIRRDDGSGEGGSSVQPDAHSFTAAEYFYAARIRLEAFGRIFSGDSALDGAALHFDVLLSDAHFRQSQTFRNLDLMLHQIDSGHLFRHRVFNLLQQKFRIFEILEMLKGFSPGDGH